MPEVAPSRLQRHADSIALALLITGASAAVFPLRRYGLILNDEGWLLHPVLRMLEGEILYRDVWLHYAPLRYHVLAGLFTVTGPSMLVERTLLALLIVANAGALYCVARRFSPIWLAWLPGTVYALAPGPWHKAPYTLCSVGWFLVLARALERPGRWRRFVLGAVVGLTLCTRHDLGVLQLVLTLAAILAAPGLGGPDRTTRRSALAGVGLGAGLVVAPFVAWYAAHDALGPLAEVLFVRGFGQAAGSPTAQLIALLSPTSLGTSIEGDRAGVLLIAPLFVYTGYGVFWIVQLARHGLTAQTALGGAILATALATIPQAYLPPLVVRFLQSAGPCYLLATWLVAEFVSTARTRIAAPAGALAAHAAAGAVVWLAIAGVPRIEPWPDYTGSWRLARNHAPVRILGDEIFASFRRADEIRLVRAFVSDRAPTDEPLFAWPWLSLYYVLLERPNPTRVLFERIRPGDHSLSGGMKRTEMDRLLDSDVRFALATQYWWNGVAIDDEVGETLEGAFYPVRGYGELVVFERTADPERLALAGILRRVGARRPQHEDVAELMEYARTHSEEPLPLRILAEIAIATGQSQHAVPMLERASTLDPHDATGLEWLAGHALRGGRLEEAAALANRAHAIRDSPFLRRLAAQLAADSR